MIVSVIGFALITGVIVWYSQQLGITPADWNYTVSLRSVGAGLGGIAGYFVVYLAVVVLVTLLSGIPSSSANIATGVAEEPLWALGALVLVNGIFVPIIEELAWRGVIQTALIASYGTIVGSVLTAAAFVLKHVIVDAGAPLLRVVSLIVLALLLCGLRARFGTVSSTVTHIGVNSIATALLITASL